MKPPVILVVSPGSNISTTDVHTGLVAGLQANGALVVQYELHGRLIAAQRMLRFMHRHKKKQAKAAGQPFDLQPPGLIDECYQACLGIFERIFRFRCDAVIVVSGVLVPREILLTLQRAQMPVGLVLTESPYLMLRELQLANCADVIWTNERSVVKDFRCIQEHTHYLPHAWLPGVHDQPTIDARAHDVVFVGTGFTERIALLEGVDWTGIDLGLYGNWNMIGDDSPLKPFVRSATIPNRLAASLYRRAKIGLNIYRTTMHGDGQHIAHADSLNPRAYELAATGSFHLSTPRAEVGEKFGPLVPTFETSAELEQLLRYWLAHDQERWRIGSRLPALVAEDTWIARGGQVFGELNARCNLRAQNRDAHGRETRQRITTPDRHQRREGAGAHAQSIDR